jgi:signal transduction histidine kinase
VTEEEARGKTTHEVFPKQQADAFTDHDEGVRVSGKAVEQEEVWPRADGDHTYLTVKFPILNHTGEVTGVGAIGTDITDRKRVEEKLLRSEKILQMRVAELEAAQGRLVDQEINLIRLAEDLENARDQAVLANRAKSEFLANMSHELRTPLNAIIGFSDMIRKQTFGPIGSPKYLEYVEDVNESGRHLLEVINDILDLAKIETGKLDLDESEVDVVPVIRSCFTLVKERCETGRVRVVEHAPRGLPALRADKRKLKQILINLLSNAVKFTPAGGRIDLFVEAIAREGFSFTVSDTGIGIASDDIPKVLTPFVQVESTLSRKYEGTGLGLPLTKSFVELHGGSLDLHSEVGVGTTVTVRFPAERIVPLPHDIKVVGTGDKNAG